MKLTTDTLKPLISQRYNCPASQIKRGRKYKNESGQVVREFVVATKTIEVVSSPDDTEIIDMKESGENTASPPKKSGINPSDWYFYVYQDSTQMPDEPPTFCFVQKKYWHKHKYLQDQENPKLDRFLEQHSFYALMEMAYEYADINTLTQKDMDQGRQLLIQLGFEENPDLNRGPAFSDVYPPSPTPWGQ